jgi:hypothetical protein
MKRSIPDKSIQGEIDILKNLLQTVGTELELNNVDTKKCMVVLPLVIAQS